MKFVIILFLAFYGTFSFSQNANAPFQQFAQEQDSMMLVAYEQKDIKAYHKHLDALLLQFNALNKSQQNNYEGFVLGAYYNLACTYALIGDKNSALTYLERSKYSDYQHLLEDSDLQLIRNEKRFKKCLAYAQKQSPNYLDILKKASKYNVSDQQQLPAFTYQSSADPHLVALRKGFNLDSIAGTGNEISQILNLLHWIHNLVPHDGNHNNPEIKNAMSMINVCKNENRGLNCRGLSIVLNECYLSMGIKSRFVTCLPKDSADTDCHVINMVYSQTLQKWLWIDPTWDAYVMDEKGILLSIEEVRERLIHNKPLIINPDANWNHRISAIKEQYLFQYMAKNLYRLECPLSSTYDYETKAPDKVRQYIMLIPTDYNALLPFEKSRNNKPAFQVTYSGNKTGFWAKPE